MMELIEQKRKEMIDLATVYGFTAKVTVKCSQELDTLLIKIQKNNEITLKQ